MLRPVDGLKLAADVELLGGVEEVANRGVFLIATKNLLGFQRPKCARFISLGRLPRLGYSATR